jgi:hypothetical protein
MARLETVLSLPCIGRGQRDGEEREERTREGERQLGGKVEYTTASALPVFDHLHIIAAFQLLDGTLEQKDISARLTFKK